MGNILIDISDIDINVLRDVYRDLRLTPKVTSFNDILSDLPGLNENFGDVLPADEVVEKIRKKYYFSSDLVKKSRGRKQDICLCYNRTCRNKCYAN